MLKKLVIGFGVFAIASIVFGTIAYITESPEDRKQRQQEEVLEDQIKEAKKTAGARRYDVDHLQKKVEKDKDTLRTLIANPKVTQETIEQYRDKAQDRVKQLDEAKQNLEEAQSRYQELQDKLNDLVAK